MAESKESESSVSKPIAVITGASKGIGLSGALKLIELGYIVIGCARSKDKMKELDDKYEECDFSSVDISDVSQVEQWSKRILSKYGSPTILINNAGVATDKALLEDVPIKALNCIIDVNVKGVMYVIKYFMNAMKQNTDIHSKIISISSPSGRIGIAEMAPYCASKWAIEGLMMSISKEVPKHITAIAYNPGGIITEMITGLVPELNGKIDECIKLGAVGPNQWAQVCIPHIIGLKREEVNGKFVDRPNLKELLNNNWKIYRQIKQSVLDKQQKK